MNTTAWLIAVTQIFGREVTDPRLENAGLLAFLFMLASVSAVVISHRYVDHEKVTENTQLRGSWLNYILPFRTTWPVPFRLLTPVGKKLRYCGWSGVGISMIVLVVISRLSE